MIEPQSDGLDAMDLLDRIGDMLIVLSDVAGGGYEERCPRDLPDTHPLGALCAGINEMLDALADERARNQSAQRDLEDQLATIERQRIAIHALSAPIIEVWAGVLCLVVVGEMDASRSQEATASLLHAIAEKRARFVIIDVTGVEMMDATATDQFIRMAKAIRLLGTECTLTGLAPDVARSLVHLGIDTSEISVQRTMRDALYRFGVREIRR
jgi:rsbT co-antagonist protein RsbR